VARNPTCSVPEPLLCQFIGSEGPCETGERRHLAGPATRGGRAVDLHSGISVAHILPAEIRNPSCASLLEGRALARLGNNELVASPATQGGRAADLHSGISVAHILPAES
jgi:hypothetical protein